MKSSSLRLGTPKLGACRFVAVINYDADGDNDGAYAAAGGERIRAGAATAGEASGTGIREQPSRGRVLGLRRVRILG